MTEQKQDKKYRLLRDGEKLERGDEALSDDCLQWIPIHVCLTHCRWNALVYVPIRRED